MSATDGNVAFVNEGGKAVKYRASDIININETDIYFDLACEATLAECVERPIGSATTGRSSRYTGMLGVDKGLKAINMKRRSRADKRRCRMMMVRRGGFLLEEEPIFHWSKMMDLDDEEALFVLKLAQEENA
jgi:hypothetical protein